MAALGIAAAGSRWEGAGQAGIPDRLWAVVIYLLEAGRLLRFALPLLAAAALPRPCAAVLPPSSVPSILSGFL